MADASVFESIRFEPGRASVADFQKALVVCVGMNIGRRHFAAGRSGAMTAVSSRFPYRNRARWRVAAAKVVITWEEINELVRHSKIE